MFPECLSEPDYLHCTISVLAAMADDPVNKPALMDWLREGINKRDGRYELRTALNALTAVYQPQRYLEIGVRLGWSLAQVCHQNPTVGVLACDTWIPDYGGVPNPGPDFVLQEINKAAPDFHGRIEFKSCNSRDLMLFADCDLITIDGDHSPDVSIEDLRLGMSHLAPGGFLVYDDLVPPLIDVWQQVKAEFPAYQYLENHESITPLGIAWRDKT